MTDLYEKLEFLESNLESDHVETVKNRLIKACSYEKTDRLPLKLYYDSSDFTYYDYSTVFEDMNSMMSNELHAICKAALIKDDTLPCIRANYGVGILPSLFGCNCKIINNSMPWVENIDSIDEIKSLLDKGIPNLRAGLGGRVFDTQEYYKELLFKYPNCEKSIPIYHPDLQGPFDVAHLIWGGDIYYAVYDEPELLHKLLQLITDTYKAFLKEIKKYINDTTGGYVYHWNTLFKGGVVLRNDSAVNLSKEMYKEFIQPYDEQILEAFGGGSIHFCGRGDQWVLEMMDCKGLQAMNFGQPPNLIFEFDFLSKVYKKAKTKGIALIDYTMDNSKLIDVLKSEYTRGITYNSYAPNLKEATELLKKVTL